VILSRWVFYAVAGLGLAIDLISKSYVGNVMRPLLQQGRNEIWTDNPILGITWVLNEGGIWGVGKGAGFLFALASVAAIIFILWMLYSAPHKRISFQITLGMILSGALGNLYDRLVMGWKVRDFINFHFIQWPVFNIADIAITVGAGLLIIATILGHPLPADTGEDSD